MIDKFANQLSIFFLSLSWILMGIILSNAYRGNNIRELSAPIGLEFIDTYEQLIAKNFTLYTYPMSLVEALYRNISFREMQISNDQKAFYENQISTKLKYNEEHSELGQELYVLNLTFAFVLRHLNEKFPNPDDQLKDKQRLKLAMDKYTKISDITRIPIEYGNGITPFLRVLDCEQNAYGDWSNTIDIMKLKMEKLMPSRLIIRSTEGIVSRNTGWRLQKYFDEGIVTRLRLLYVGGIAQMWVNLQNHNRLLEISRLKGSEETTEDKLDEDKPVTLSLKHNVSTVFVILISFVGCSLSCFCFEYIYFKRSAKVLCWKITRRNRRRKLFVYKKTNRTYSFKMG